MHGSVAVTYWGLDAALTQALKRAAASQHFVQGLEQIDEFLTKEAKGLRMLQEKTGQAEVHRLSRLLLLTNDGSDRFYHNVESVLQAHRNRTWGVMIAASAEVLGKLTTPKGSPVKALLIADRKALELFLAECRPAAKA